MPRTARLAPGDVVFHVLNRFNARARLLITPADFALLLQVLVDTAAAIPMRLLAYGLMPSHWHLVLWPWEDGDLGRYMRHGGRRGDHGQAAARHRV